MTAHSILIGLLLTFPWALVSIVTLGTAVAAVQRWLGRFRRSDKARMAGQSVPSQSRRDGGAAGGDAPRICQRPGGRFAAPADPEGRVSGWFGRTRGTPAGDR